MQAKLRRISIVFGFVLLLALLVANTVVIRRQVEGQVRTHAQVIHTNDVLVQIERTESLLKDAETGQRGYLYTEEPSYLEPYNAARQQVGHAINDLAALTADDPRQQANVAKLRTLAEGKLGELAETLALFQAGRREEARKLVLSNVGKRTMDQVRSVVTQMTEEEIELDAKRTGRYRVMVARTQLAVLITSALAAIGLIGLAFATLRIMRSREQHSRELLERESWFRITLSSVGDGVIATDADGHVRFLNPVAEEMIGISLADAEGKPIEAVFPIFNEQSHQPVENPVAKVMAAGRVVGLANHTVLRHSSGRLTPIEDSAAPIRDADNQLAGVVLVFRDATHERKTQEVLRKTEKLAAAARLASTMAHEINNPLEAVGNLLYLAKTLENLPPEALDFLLRAEEELNRVAHITRQTLGFYREGRGPEETDVASLVESVLKLYANKLRTKSIELSLDFKPTPAILSYAGELKQVVANLVSNAADAVPVHGSITVSVEPSPREDGVEISVRDNGPGIRKEDIPRLFEAFYTTKQDVGTGLGLWVVKEIAERHGGSVRVLTPVENGRGTAFTVSLPRAFGSAAEAAS